MDETALRTLNVTTTTSRHSSRPLSGSSLCTSFHNLRHSKHINLNTYSNMRSPAVVFSLFAVSALSPSVVYGSPVPNGVTHGSSDHHRAPSAVAARGLGFLNEVFVRADSTHVAHAAHPTYTSKPKVASIAGIDLGYVLPACILFTPANKCFAQSQATGVLGEAIRRAA